MVEENKCIAAMQWLEDCQGLCVTGSAVLALSTVPVAGAACFCSGWKQ